MNISEKYWWPLIGVILGWFLTLFSSSLKERSEKRYRTGELLYKLIHVDSQLKVMMRVTDGYWKRAEDFGDYERFRKGISDRHFLEPASQLSDLTKAVDGISGPYPLDALRLHSTIHILTKCKMANFSESSKLPEVYLHAISAHEVALEQTQEQICNDISRLARRHGIFTFVKFKFQNYKIRRLEQKTNGFLRAFTDEIFDAIKAEEKQGAPEEASKSSSN